MDPHLTSPEHPITPPPELVREWGYEHGAIVDGSMYVDEYIATQASRWGADQELHALLAWLRVHHYDNLASDLLAARRPKPPSLAEQALALINHDPDNQPFLSKKGIAIIRRALECLQELESDG